MKTSKMRSESEVRNQAVNLKAKLAKREKDLLELNSKIAANQMGIGVLVKPQMLEHMKKQLEERAAHQWRDRQNYAALRWVLGITQDIDVSDLEK